MGVKISQLPEVLSANSSDYLVINHEGATSQIMVETLMDSYLSSAGFITESDLADYLSSNLGNYLSEYVTKSDLENCCYLSEPDLYVYLVDNLSNYLSEYLTESDLSEYVTRDDLDHV